MLWYKAWLELRFRVLLTGAIILANCVFAWQGAHLILEARGNHEKLIRIIGTTPIQSGDLVETAAWSGVLHLQVMIIIPIVAMILAGSGLNTQTAYGMMHGLHSSMLYTLSLPVSRSRLVITRASLGFAFFAAYLLFNLYAPLIIGPFRGIPLHWVEGLQYIPGLLAGGFFYYSLFVLTSAVLDEFWSSVLGFFLIGGFTGYSSAPKHGSLELIGMMRGTHYLGTGEWPYLAWLLYIALGLLLLWVSVLIVERKEV